ncbi:Myb-related protein 3R-1 [Artemisia annua]|uniref:Myb-related protein 3R-1 n=1 Tax=Artemisia annua TaxID=35608 RepID=A0A2U1NEH1_ARTAN|nr:Myb-related protein 3R-1 [Artemisia annua]
MEGDPTAVFDGVTRGRRIIHRDLNGRTTGPTRRSTKGQWTAEEDETLQRAVRKFDGKHWKKIAQCCKGRTDVQCLHRWQKVLNPALVKGPWTKEEDEDLVRLVEKYGAQKWSTIAEHLPGRIGKQCRERTDNAIKNHWNSSLRKKLDAYMESGLLDKFQGLPSVVIQSTPTTSSGSDSDEFSKFIEPNYSQDPAEPCTDRGQCEDFDYQKQAGISSSATNNAVGFDVAAQTLTSENDCPDMTPPPDGSSDPLLYQQSYYSDLVPSQLPSGTFNSESSYRSFGLPHIYTYDSQFFTNQEDNMGAQDQMNPVTDPLAFNNQEDNIGAQDQTYPILDPLVLASSDVFSSGQVNGTLQLDRENQTQREFQSQQQETLPLSYEPPVFPSTGIQFLSCDLQSGGDLLQEYSPLGIRQLMRAASVNCFSPCRLWDSPSRDDSPEAVLKTAAKTFTCTPSILKKRHRDVLSPLSQNPNAKKHGHASFLNDENKDVQLQSLSQSGPISNDKENLNPTADVEMAQKEDIRTTVNVQQPHGVLVEHASVENSGIFGETPLKNSFESPSPWNSPWSLFVHGPQIDTDITLADVEGYVTSPGERSYDALGLMNQLSEQSASAYANAREVLGDETPDSLLKKRLLQNSESSRQDSNILSERRVLDFSDCVSPKKGEQNPRHSSSVSYSSPSSYLLKGCR